MIKPSLLEKPRRTDYPTSDGKPMAETELHRDLLIELIDLMKWWYRAEPSVCVSGNLLVYYEEGNKRKHLAPDVFVVKGVGNHQRDYYLTWEEGRGLDLAIELTSKSTAQDDLGKKRELYRVELGVQEYFLFDPREEYLAPSFQGFRRVGEEFVPIEPVAGRIPSEILGLHLERKGNWLRLWDPSSGMYLLTEKERAALDRQRAEDEATLRLQEKQRADEEQLRADEQAALRLQEKQRAEEEQQRADEQAALRLQEQQRADEQAALRLQEQQRADEQAALRLQEQQRADEEKQRADEQAALRLQEQQRADEQAALRLQEQQRADEQVALRLQEQQRADEQAALRLQEQQRADEQAALRLQEQQRADELQAALNQLRAELAAQQQPKTKP